MYTSYIGVGDLLFFMTMWAYGYAFVEIVNLMNERKNPFISRYGNYKDFKRTFAFALLFFFLCGVVILRDKKDLSGYCKMDYYHPKAMPKTF